MRKHLLLIASLAAIISLAITGCNKDKNPDPPPPKTKTQLLATGTWKFSSATVGGTDVSAFLQTCQKDNILTFTAAGGGTVDEGTTKCNAADPQTNSFTWNLQTNETVLFVSATLFTGGSSTFTLITLSETQLVVSQNVMVGGTPQNAVVTFVH